MKTSAKLLARGLSAVVLGLFSINLVESPLNAALPEELGDYAFVMSKHSRDVTILSTSGDDVVGNVSLERMPSQIVVSENHRKLIATHAEEKSLSLVDLDMGRTTRTIDLGFRPDRLQIDDGSGVIAVSGVEAGRITMISLDQEAVLFSNEDVRHPSDLMFNRDGVWLYIAERDAGTIAIIDARDGKLIDRIILEDSSDDVVELIRTPGGKTGLALHGESGLISALDLENGIQVGRTELSGPVERGFPSANSQFFMIPQSDGTSMSLVSSWTYRESERLPAPAGTAGVVFAMFDTIAFAIGSVSREMLSISLLEDRDPLPLSLPGQPETGLTVDAGKKVYVALSDTNQIAVIDAVSGELTSLIDDVGDQPWAITAAGGLGYCH